MVKTFNARDDRDFIKIFLTVWFDDQPSAPHFFHGGVEDWARRGMR